MCVYAIPICWLIRAYSRLICPAPQVCRMQFYSGSVEFVTVVFDSMVFSYCATFYQLTLPFCLLARSRNWRTL